MAIYQIPKYKLEELNKKINHIRNKGVRVTFDIVNDSVFVPAPSLGKNVSIECVEADVEGRYIINGWRFVATIEHSSPENIIRVADTALADSIPERYRVAGRECEHCHIRRDRNDTYLVYNEDTAEWKQVGKTCLLNYTSGLNAETCALMSSVMVELMRLNEDVRSGGYSDFYDTTIGWDMNFIKKCAYKYVKKNGYVPQDTKIAFKDDLRENELSDQGVSDADIDEVTKWLTNASPSDWQRNTKAVWNKNNFEIRDTGYILSAVAIFFRDKAKREAQAKITQNKPQSEYAGEVGDKVSFVVTSVSVIYSRTGGYRGHYYEYPVYKMTDEAGRIYIWGSSNMVEVEVGHTIKGSIKKLSEFRGEKQTELTRCKVIEGPAETTRAAEPESGETQKILDDWFKQLEEDEN